MHLTRSFVGKEVHWNYKNLSIIAVLGKLGMSLQKIPELYQEERFEFAYSMVKPGVDHLAVFCYTPPIELNLVKPATSEYKEEDYVYAMSLQKAAMQEVLGEFLQKTAFVQSDVDPAIILGLEMGFETYAVGTYEMADALAIDLNEDIEKVHGALGYANFLTLHRGFPFMESIRMAEKKFDLKGKLW